jgi:5' nucleotidase, deoxy (Pyrimidine), cytosolic type C protein (NT5C)
MKIAKIYVDMDGVLCNFEKRYEERYGKLTDESRRTKFRSNFDDFIKTKQFATLDPMPDMKVLVNYLNQLKIPKEICSSTAYEETYEDIKEQKEKWLKDHDIKWKANFVPGKRHKNKFATPDSVIIDDTYSVIEDWRKAGGIGIWHKNAKDTILQLATVLTLAK